MVYLVVVVEGRRPSLPVPHVLVVVELVVVLGLKLFKKYYKSPCHKSFSKCTVPQGSWVFGCSGMCHSDSRYWDQPQEFRPERFLDQEGRVKTPKEGFIPFGTGKPDTPASSLESSSYHVAIIIAMPLTEKLLAIVMRNFPSQDAGAVLERLCQGWNCTSSRQPFCRTSLSLLQRASRSTLKPAPSNHLHAWLKNKILSSASESDNLLDVASC